MLKEGREELKPEVFIEDPQTTIHDFFKIVKRRYGFGQNQEQANTDAMRVAGLYSDFCDLEEKQEDSFVVEMEVKKRLWAEAFVRARNGKSDLLKEVVWWEGQNYLGDSLQRHDEMMNKVGNGLINLANSLPNSGH